MYLHDQDTPLNSQLLNNNDGTTLRVLGNLGEVDWDLRRRDANSDTVQDATSNEHAATSDSNLQSSTDEPPETGEKKGIATTKLVGDRTSNSTAND